jgi:plastocyanin
MALLTACSTGDAASTTSAAPPPTTQAAAAQPVEVAVTAVDYGYDGLPTRVAPGTSITLTNTSATELHEFVAIRLPDDETRPIEELVQLPPEALAAFFPLVETVIIAPPGEAGFAVEGIAVLTEPGRYAILCAIPTGADPVEYLDAVAEAGGGPPQVDGGPPHFAVGMYAEVVVE